MVNKIRNISGDGGNENEREERGKGCEKYNI